MSFRAVAAVIDGAAWKHLDNVICIRTQRNLLGGRRGLRGRRAGGIASSMTESSAIVALRARLCRLFGCGVAAADPEKAARASLEAAPMSAPSPGGRLEIVAVGKAAVAMAAAAQAALARQGLAAAHSIVVTGAGNAAPPAGAELHVAGHPVPDAAGAAAGEAVLARATALAAGDRLLVLVSGGGSAMLPAPAAGLSLEDKAAVNRLLLASGADIVTVNLIRQQLSRIKGGGLLRAAAPAQVKALILSDVVGDDLRAVASGPTLPPIGSRAEAVERLERLGLWHDLPDAVRRHLAERQAAVPPLPEVDNRLIGSNAQSVDAMAAAASALGLAVHVAATPLVGDVAGAAARILAARKPGLHLWGGETTVRLAGDGLGGRNQELALRVALGAARAEGWAPGWAFLSGGTDGRDGPTEAAGGLVDGASLVRMRAAGIDPEAALAGNDSNPALCASGDLLVTGPTGTNVADLQLLWLE